MEIIDAHLHYSAVQVFQQAAEEKSEVDYSKIGLESIMSECKISAAVGMGLAEATPGLFPDVDTINPMGLDLADNPEKLYTCLGINPVRLKYDRGEQELSRLENAIEKSKVVGLKIYPGYFAFDANAKVYQPVYELAKAYNLPIIIHCGDTFCDKSFLKYAHPLSTNQAAIQHRKINFILAHFGNPWVTDAAMVISNNPNVFADLSGIVIGTAQDIQKALNNQPVINNLKTGLAYVDNYEKFLFGSDWPLVQLAPYIEYVKQLVPEKHYDKVFYKNALQLFTKIN
ncbi:amidohydrolase [Metallumcola ferriviriculae]|uniref:Amidohydrolase n=1 Tax=Metallumcola ferriviriculae TaxID=3039180 RepID=A0AAU0UMQ5_9FIRM|nr:amidohydrolase [Desulfitibacteraceae bacterium MK1]